MHRWRGLVHLLMAVIMLLGLGLLWALLLLYGEGEWWKLDYRVQAQGINIARLDLLLLYTAVLVPCSVLNLLRGIQLLSWNPQRLDRIQALRSLTLLTNFQAIIVLAVLLLRIVPWNNVERVDWPAVVTGEAFEDAARIEPAPNGVAPPPAAAEPARQ